MKRRIFGFSLLLCLLALPAFAAEYAVIQTNMGDIKVELNRAKAPVSVNNFLAYVNQGFFEETIFHRVIKDFMIQGGGFTSDLKRKPTLEPIVNEATNGLKNVRGSIAMARTNVIDSATSQFFINLKDNAFLDHSGVSPATYGYAVFGQVVEGMEVVDAIARKKTRGINGLFKDMPTDTIVIKGVRHIKEEAK
ncbi:peptidylprolyl isomerase [Trichloromonas sp.]|uniref:peptidylprolyl isomerase n=1 Tax=Trichloromonas sp. TaxID=3069249 RepID=UPI003D81673C